MIASGMILLGLSLLGAGPSGVWRGQDEHDLVGPSSELKGSDVQDIHFALSGLPPQRTIVSALVSGEGGDQWESNGAGHFRAALQRAPKSRTADLFVEPTRVETGRSFAIKLTYDDGTTAEFYVRGGKADPNLRLKGSALAAKWVGQERQDWVGPSLGVGPDGLADVRIALTKLSPKVEVQAVRLDGPGGSRWQYGHNPEGTPNAELVRDPKDPARADFYFHPGKDLAGQKLKLTVTYANGKSDAATLVGGRFEPKLAMPRAALPGLVASTIVGRWLGHDGSPGTAPGDVHVALSSLPVRTIAGAELTDSVRGVWAYRNGDRARLDADAGAWNLNWRPSADRGHADLFFAPVRDETGTTLTLRLVFQDGSMAVAQFPGGPCDPGLRAAPIVASVANARPGADLNDLANRFGTVKLSPGVYPLNHPLVLNHPVTLIGGPGVTLRFAQAPGDAPWSTAIKIHAGHTTLQGFAVRFAGPVRWRHDVSYGPAVIGATDNFDTGHNDLKMAMDFAHLDIETPPAANPRAWEEAPRLFRLAGVQSGRIVGNVLKGGIVELFDGPWQVVDNVYRGTAPGTYADSVFAVHYTFDLVVRGNRAKPVGPSGKTWRFLVMTGSDSNARVEDNIVEGIGPRDDDTIPWANAPEIVLTESYSLHFEGKPSALSADGRIVRLPQPQGEPPRTGDVVAVLAGPHAGDWRRIAQTIGPNTYLMESPLPTGTDLISIATGFVNVVLRSNTVDARGGKMASGMVLVGNHFGTRVQKNKLLGGEAFRITAAPTEHPMFWGWSHAPFLGAVIEGNLIEDADRGANLGVEHGKVIKSNQGRVYMSVTLKDNTVRWSEPFVKRHARDTSKDAPPGLIVGYPGSLDPGELVVAEQGNRVQGPPASAALVPLRVNAAMVNGRPVRDRDVK